MEVAILYYDIVKRVSLGLLVIGVMAVIGYFSYSVLFGDRASTQIVKDRSAGESSPRKTGRVTLDNGLTGEFCKDPDGTVKDEYQSGALTGSKFMNSHVAAVNRDGSVDVYTDADGTTERFVPSSVVIMTYPRYDEILGATSDLEKGDCIVLYGVESGRTVEVRGMR